MSEADTNAAPTWATAIRRRRKALLQRLAMGVATAMVFSPLFGWTFSSLWVSVYFAVQLLDLIVFSPINSGKVERMGPVRSAAGVVMLFLNAAAFGKAGAAALTQRARALVLEGVTSVEEAVRVARQETADVEPDAADHGVAA